MSSAVRPPASSSAASSSAGKLTAVAARHEGFAISVRTVGGAPLSVEGVQPTDTVLSIKEKIRGINGAATVLQRLIFAGHALDNEQTVAGAAIESEVVVMLIVRTVPAPTAGKELLRDALAPTAPPALVEEEKEEVGPLVAAAGADAGAS